MLAKSICSLTVCLMSALPSVCWASVYSAKIRPMQFSRARQDFSRGLDASTIQPVKSRNEMTSADIQKVIPTDLDASLNEQQIATRIVDRSLKNALNSDMLKQSAFGRTAASVQNSLQTNIVVANREPNSIKHEFKFAMEPAQSQARLRYTGLADASLTYQATNSKTDLEIREPVHFMATDVVYHHTTIPNDQRDLMSMRWAW